VTPSKSNPILVAEDDKKTASLIALYLEGEGFKAVHASDGQQALELARRHHPILVILDLMLPSIDGWAVCRELRSESDVPILILTARKEEIDRVLGLSLGADDYVVKPFSPRELVERVKAILRRARPDPAKVKKVLVYRDLLLDSEKRRVRLKGRSILVTPSEYKLLQALMSSPGRVFAREELLQQLYPMGETVVDRIIDVHLGKLRQKIEEDPSDPKYIITVKGVGYRFADDDN
jgi:DNA-binding response OmpR family regulator